MSLEYRRTHVPGLTRDLYLNHEAPDQVRGCGGMYVC